MKAGVDEVIIYCVNDGAVMTGWAKDQKVDCSDLINMLGDPSGEATRALGVVLDHPGPMGKLGYARCKRFAAVIKDGVIKALNISEAEDDPAGDDKPESSCVEQILKELEGLKAD